jgi:hypothetical protein
LDLSLLIDTFEEMEKTTSRISLTGNLVDLFKNTPGEIIDKVVYLIQGKLAPDSVLLLILQAHPFLPLRRLTTSPVTSVTQQDK